jgi:Fe-S-cluster-containing dehydrogenase component
VKLCPERCLRLNAERIVELAEPDKCTGCRLCEWLCPDFAIRVNPTRRRRCPMNAIDPMLTGKKPCADLRNHACALGGLPPAAVFSPAPDPLSETPCWPRLPEVDGVFVQMEDEIA